MFNKSFIAIAIGLTGISQASQENLKAYSWQNKVNYVINADADVRADHSGRSRYIIQLMQAPAATHAAQLFNKAPQDRTSVSKASITQKLPQKISHLLQTSQLEQYRQEIAHHQGIFKTTASKTLGRPLQAKMQFDTAFNGMVLELTPDEAKTMLTVPQVLKVIKETPTELQTDNGPQLIGASNLWDGNATGLAAKGDGIIIGILDTGINTDNRAFSAVGDDGHNIINPLGSGNYLGDCVKDATLCNDKLIGVYSFPLVTDEYNGLRPANGEDYNGHGSHTASTAAGNALVNVPVLMPNIGEEVGDGIETGTVLSNISGVAPHANIISYQVCDQSGCYPSLTIASVELAIKAGVDVLNYSIGPRGGVQNDPWNTASDIAFLSAREAGIFVAMAAGNAGPDAETVGNVAPWAISVAASSHQRVWSHVLSGSGVTGDPLPQIEGLADVFTSNGVINALSDETEIVYAGDYKDINGNSLALCNSRVYFFDPVMADLRGKVVICDRGEISLADKVTNMFFAAGVIIRNTPTSNQNMASARYALPSLLINELDGKQLLEWMKRTDTPKVSISAANAEYDQANADILADFSSRGPYKWQTELMVPHIAAPGVDIYAAYADEMPFTSVNDAAPSDFAFLSGTSMASPHVAGSAALLRQLHPDWTPAEIQSAMMLTATTNVLKEDGKTPAGIFDIGSGRLQIDKAAQAGLVMDVPIDEYKAANPELGGDVTSLNLPVLTSTQCMNSCSWTRTLRATRDGSWTVSSNGNVDGVTISASPSSFDIKEGESVTVTFTANIALRANEDWSFMQVNLAPSDNSPMLSLPVAVKPLIALVPAFITQDYFWNKGDLELADFHFRYPENLLFNIKPLEKATSYHLTLAADSDNRSPFDNVNDGTALSFINVPDGSSNLRVIVGESSAIDIDVFIGLDSNNNGIPEIVELTQACATSMNVGEACRLNAGSGRYWVLAHNYKGSGDPLDAVRLDVLLQPNTETLPALVTIPNMSTKPYDALSAHLSWSGDMIEGVYYSELEVFDRNTPTAARAIARSNLVVNRVKPSVKIDLVKGDLSHRKEAELNIQLPTNPTSDSLTYTLNLAMADNLTITDVETNGDISLNHDKNNIKVTLAPGETSTLIVAKINQKSPISGDFKVDWSLNTDKSDFDVQQGSLMVSNTNKAPSLAVPKEIKGNMGSDVKFNIVSEDANQDPLSYTVTQISGPAVDIKDDGKGEVILSLPEVNSSQVAKFNVNVTDGEFSQSSDMSLEITYINTENSGGAIFWSIVLLGLFGLRRKRLRTRSY
ncbi:S8 family serine peptidase [Shewanella oneidensis MR-1]|uniref:Extracellular peptidase family S8A n=1 Tax=Shewanella oneidensis (strain ATCC 700550 / JCM 31522 / CIP 106686 / LMG 19005 / NCIMB 14063 / MR-1) TaxID=211586 RepID=Q8EC42_SHEON|nr:S8 family serine peptidase [Shewanella oneidensis]AAN56300.1 extracellular peptidase family S8A [Shewanella oneidensis MR-1]MDX5999274.1 S8 family serine peptidase [Shewanella oneidensis]MEE2028978.1 hypothetical protein [Shewanella oneidensis]QKG97713.1 S8 family serine peptidase [Shewanella oneidensis MR-1]